MMQRIRSFLKVSPDTTNSDVIGGILMLGFAALWIVVTVVSLVREWLNG